MANDNKRKTTDGDLQQNQKGKEKTGKADHINSIITSPTDAARSRKHTDTWSNQGTNISYEGQTAPGGSGSVGTGNASGQSATGARITTTDSSDAVTNRKDDNSERSEDLGKEDTLGNP